MYFSLYTGQYRFCIYLLVAHINKFFKCVYMNMYQLVPHTNYIILRKLLVCEWACVYSMWFCLSNKSSPQDIEVYKSSDPTISCGIWLLIHVSSGTHTFLWPARQTYSPRNYFFHWLASFIHNLFYSFPPNLIDWSPSHYRHVTLTIVTL